MGFVDLKNKNNFDFYALEGVIEKAPQFVKKWEIKKTEIWLNKG